MQGKRHIEVAVSLPVYGTYTYIAPAALAGESLTGRRATVPFGNKTVTGYILGEAEALPDTTVKTVHEIIDDEPMFPPSMLDFFNWVAGYYLHPPGETIKSALPAGEIPKRTPAKRVEGAAKTAIGEAVKPDAPPDLTAEQAAVVSDLVPRLDQGFFACLLAGVTGSGKTEVYMRIAEEALNRGKTALILVPEIALISQAEHRFKARFGENIAVLHSGLSRGERWGQWLKILHKKAGIAIGTRSAIFAPFASPGVIIVDEEHDTSYKQEGSLRYNARDLALVRAKMAGAMVILGSATPSIQSIFNARTGKFSATHLLKQRVNNNPLPVISVVDLRQSPKKQGARAFISNELFDAIQQTLAAGNQVLLFLNRRGFSSFPVCAACGETLRCRHCDITLTLHKAANAYKCHFCGFSLPATAVCETCGSGSIKLLGMGTEKIQEAMQQLFPEASVARLDKDTTTRKGAIARILKDIKNRKTDILVGTQMIAKGHDFPGITLIGVICADLSLNFPDFRAGERTFQLLAQVAGRAGRGDAPGRVILQTYNPGHFSIAAATKQDYEEFYNQEITFRKALAYPPFSRVVQLKISATSPEKAATGARAAGDAARNLQQKEPSFAAIEVLGPVESPLHKLANRYRWQILLKAPAANLIKQFITRLISENGPAIKKGNVRLVVDVDPFFMM
ncbi:MAG: primosomal protein N' [Thermodesulfobacteriota bacterium]|nr:primosomal protein N' [Thermodesulfobacteriota bacterium]